MFNWPKTIIKPGLVVVTGRHLTPFRLTAAQWAGSVAGLLIAAQAFLRDHSPVNVWTAKALAYLFTLAPQDAWGDTEGLFLAGGLLTAFPFILLFSYMLAARTTVKIYADFLEVAGVRYPRDVSPIQFSNVVLDANGTLTPEQVGAGVRAMTESTSLRMYYNGPTNAIVGTFMKPEHANRFAYVCNSALFASTPRPQLVRGFEVIKIHSD